LQRQFSLRSVLQLPPYALYASISRTHWNIENVSLPKTFIISLLWSRLIIIVDITVRTSSLFKKYTATCVLVGNMCLFDCCTCMNEQTYVSFNCRFFFEINHSILLNTFFFQTNYFFLFLLSKSISIYFIISFSFYSNRSCLTFLIERKTAK
jgi:hypothetical protein